jgi:hypothetical protein
MKNVNSIFVMLVCFAILTIASTSQAFFINFENGTDGGRVNDITGISFMNYGGYAPIYSDIRTGLYNAHSDDLNLTYGAGQYHLNGYFCIWAGPEADARGVKIDFTQNDGTWFQTGYSSYSNFYIETFFTDGTSTSTFGVSNLGSSMNYLKVTAESGQFIDYVVLHDSGNYWIADDMSGDASGINSVPEPSTFLLFGGGLAGFVIWRRKKQS